MATNTTRLGLIKPAGTEPRSVVQINTNSESLDGFLPCILVNDGVTPPTASLYDGALVKEKTSGKIWEARKNGGGTYDKVWVRWPFYVKGTPAVTPLASGTSYGALTLTAIAGGIEEKNSAGSLNGGRITIPITGLYVVSLCAIFAANANGNRAMTVNGSLSGNDVGMQCVLGAGYATTSTALTLTQTRRYAQGDELTIACWQNSGGSLNVSSASFCIGMIEPN